jgi:hypothetical protein
LASARHCKNRSSLNDSSNFNKSLGDEVTNDIVGIVSEKISEIVTDNMESAYKESKSKMLKAAL